jgi:two-component system nitrate/nitrite response regulator NarL
MAVIEGSQLTEREDEVYGLLVTGIDTAEIATRLEITTAGVKSHIGSIFRKLGVTNRAAAISLALGPPREVATEGLTERQAQVLRLVADGLTTTEVARALWLSPSTVRFHLHSAYRALRVRSRYEALAMLAARPGN